MKQAKANYDLAQVQFDRIESQYKKRFVSEQDFDQAKSNLQSARSQWQQAKLNLSYTELVAPYSGTISIVNVSEFEYVTPSEDVMHIQSNQLLKIIFQVPNYLIKDLSKQKPEAVVRFDAFDDKTFPITYQEISTDADATTGGYTVTSIMERPTDIALLPGMSGQVEMPLQNQGQSRVPVKALLQDDGGQFVWRVLENGEVTKTPVTLSEKGYVESGLNDGDRIVISGVANLEEGMKVRPWERERGL